jgi:hypothetical protein
MFCRYGDEACTVEPMRIDRCDGHGPRPTFRVTVEGAYGCSHPTIEDLLAHHTAANITIKERAS